ncbi:tetratricopeptide repeat protein [Polynucleobacter ibericus]|uniref:O-linked N-acetylglucosamine transferase, SPINDLY family protein n=1 Tax=Polynucleobacter ibericus TaxID=1819725 RepID=UPI001BFD94C3|nr:tetratricopeptide repeat protein [Polynucleobacter ibericus]QWE08230.1 tetratricopeptide repeat protein [Polynucleobacter ibericus]
MFQKVFEALQNNQLLEAEFLLKEVSIANPDNPDALHLMGVVCGMQNRPIDALMFFERALLVTPDDPALLFNAAKALSALQRDAEALKYHRRAIDLDPQNPEAWVNYGRSLDNLRKREEALDCYEKAVTLQPNMTEGWFNKGKIFGELKRYEEALHAYITAYQLRPTEPFLLGIILHYKMLICDWADLEGIYLKVQQDLRAHQLAAEPFGYQGISTSEQDLLETAKIFAKHRFPATERSTTESVLKPKNEKIRIAYLCGEFRDQATSVLMTGVYECHDPEHFEIYALDNGWDDGGILRPRMKNAFTEMIDISQKTDSEVVQLIQDLNIDILVNLNGYFGEGRQNIFASHPAPIQVNYLGFPGTLGAEYMDYLIADSVVIPPDSRVHYVEKIAYMPNSYQANDSKRIISDKQNSRAELGLPEIGFVYCCFNNNYKITPETFDCWMRILKAVEGSVLWLIQDNEVAEKNLKAEALKRGISSDRIIFAKRLPLPEHLARQKMADLFLDTLPYNAHTTASDALWAGVPVLTLPGKTFPGRVAASLLNALEMQELIVQTPEEYEQRAIELAHDKSALQAIKARLAENRLVKPLFDTPLFTKNLEALYKKMYERHEANLPPEHIAGP